MSSNTFPVLFNSQMIGATASTVYDVPTTPAGITLQNLQLKLTNVTNATRTVTVYAVPSAGSPSPTNAVALDMAVPPNDYILIPVERLGNGGTIQALADTASAVNIQPIGGKLHTP